MRNLDEDLATGKISLDDYRMRRDRVLSDAVTRPPVRSRVEPPAFDSDAVDAEVDEWRFELDEWSVPKSPVDKIIRPVQGMLAGSVRLLPPQDRDRYAEELRAELGDVSGWSRQLAYGLRVMCRAWSLRRSLKAARRVSGA